MAEAARGRRTGWASVVVERLALPALVVVSAGLSASMQLLVVGRIRLTPLALTVAGITGLLALLRLMDDLKDLDKDRIAHPERPLARGALAEADARRGVRVGLGTLLAGAAAITLWGPPSAGAWLAVCAGWAFLMYREFFAPELLGARPVLYAVSHQAILLPMYAFAAAAVGGGGEALPRVWWFAATGLGASFALEVCRKLDPEAHPVLATYRTRLGPAPALGLAGAAVTLVVVAAVPLGVAPILWPISGLVLGGLVVVWTRPGAFRVAAGAAGLLAFTQPIAPLVTHLWRGS